ncbi:MAG: helix-turn-helix domain-containing protein [Planctomycetia bacterium]|nr:helix-turn-helix domain-containing protein [Planctomycetia bacterium]
MTEFIKDLSKRTEEISEQVERDKAELAQWRTQKEAAELLGVSQHTLIEYRKGCLIPSYKIGKQWLYKLSDIEKLKDSINERDRVIKAETEPVKLEDFPKSFDDIEFTGIPDEFDATFGRFEYCFDNFNKAIDAMKTAFQKLKESNNAR